MAASVTTGPTNDAGSSGSPTGNECEGGEHLGHHLVVDVGMDVQTGRQGAALAGQQGGAEERGHGAGGVEIGVGEDDVGRLPAELEGQRA